MAAPTFTFTAPSSDDIYGMSKAKWRALKVNAAADLDTYVVQAIAYVSEVTGRYFTDWPAPSYSDQEGGSVSAAPIDATPMRSPLLTQAVRMRTEQIVFQAQNGYLDTVTDDAIQSFSAGPYSETRKDPTRRGESKTLNTWVGLNELLWTLMTDGRYDFWIAFLGGKTIPAFEVEEVVWDGIGRDYGLYRGATGSEPWTMWG